MIRKPMSPRRPPQAPKGALATLNARIDAGNAPALAVPKGISFHEFMTRHARVRIERNGRPEFVPYSPAGREPLLLVIGIIDFVLGNDVSYLSPETRQALFGTIAFGKVMTDAEIAPSGGAQFGKTILGLHLKEYLAAVKGYNSYYVLPDDGLVQDIIDGKERPEVLDQIPWLNQMVAIGKEVNKSGKTVNRKGAMLFTDGKQTAVSYMRGMQKIPTSLSTDCVIQDETDDIPPKTQKFLGGRMTASSLRLFVAIGTQRYAGAGQNKVFEDGTQHVGYLSCRCGRDINPEDNWPEICRMALGGVKDASNPRLTPEGTFKSGRPDDQHGIPFDHNAEYYFACPHCGAELDRAKIRYKALRPDRIAQRKWSIKVSQMCCSGLPVKMFAADWCQNAVRDPDSMTAFRCDRLATPKSTAQSLTRELITRATTLEAVNFSLTPPRDAIIYAGLDTGDRCWFTARAVYSPFRKHLVWAEQVSAERVRSRVPLLVQTLGVRCLFVDAGPLRDLARDLAITLNGMDSYVPRSSAGAEPPDHIDFGNGITWDGERKQWRGIRCAPVEFTQKPGAGIVQKLGITLDNMIYPLIACNREDSIQRVINELLTAEEGVVEVIGGKLRTEPSFRLPARGPGAPAILETYEQHLLAGSRKVRSEDGKQDLFIDKIENHFLLSTAYSGLAETIGGSLKALPLSVSRVTRRGGLGRESMRDRKAGI